MTKPIATKDHSSRTARAPSFAFVHSLQKGLEVIKSFNGERPKQTVADVARATGLDRSAARRFLLTLQALGYVEQIGREFQLAPRTLQLGYSYLASQPWWHVSQRIAEQLTAEIGLSTAIGVLDGENVSYVAYASAGRFPQLTDRRIGTLLPASASAIGRVLIAALPPDELTDWLANARREAFTAKTTTSRTALTREIARVRQQGWSFVDQELALGLRSIGVPVRSRAGDVVAGISISVLDGRLAPAEMKSRHIERLRKAAQQLTESMPV